MWESCEQLTKTYELTIPQNKDKGKEVKGKDNGVKSVYQQICGNR